MQKISSIAIAAFLMFFISSCTKEELVQDAPTPDSGRVVFSINTGKNMVSTKADKKDEQAIRTVGVFIVKQNGDLAGEVERFYESKDLTGKKLAVSVPAEIMDIGNKAYLIANWGDKNQYEAIKTEKELLDLVAYTKPEDIASKGIPMVCGPISLNFTGGIAVVDANMKRVMSTLCAQVLKNKHVIMGPKDFTVRVHGISNKKGYCFKDQPYDSGIDQEWTPVSEAMDEEFSLGYFYQSNPFKIEVICNATNQSCVVDISAEKAKMRNRKYMLNIHPKPASEGKGEFKVTIEDWDLAEPDVDFRSFNLVDIEAGVDFGAKGIIWEEATRTLDITNATEGSVLKFNTVGVTAVKTSVVPFYNKNASSIGGEKSLANILEAGPPTAGKIAFKINTPVQTLKVPLDILVSIQSIEDKSKTKTITIKSRPDYAGTGIQPVMMATTEGKKVFWAPVNVGATKLPESVPTTANTDITESCGKLFQWGRLSGVAATNNSATMETELAKDFVFPIGEEALANMGYLDNKFIPCEKGNSVWNNWILFKAEGNPPPKEMVSGAWYQKLWNSGTEESPVKTPYDPCPAGWRVPTAEEWQAVIGTSSVDKEWNSATKLMTFTNAGSDQKLILPAAGIRPISGKESYSQGSAGRYWSSSVSPQVVGANSMYFDHTTMPTRSKRTDRAAGCSVRCVQE